MVQIMTTYVGCMYDQRIENTLIGAKDVQGACDMSRDLFSLLVIDHHPVSYIPKQEHPCGCVPVRAGHINLRSS